MCVKTHHFGTHSSPTKNPWRSENHRSWPPTLPPVKVYHGFHEASPGKNSSLSFKSSDLGRKLPKSRLFCFPCFRFFRPNWHSLDFAFSIISHMARHVVNPGRSKKKGVGSLFGGKQTSKENVQNVFCWTENPGSSCLCLNTFRLAGSNFRLPTDSID